MLRITKEGFVDENGKSLRQMRLKASSQSAEWTAKQENSLGEYDQTHCQGNTDPLINALFSLFKHFLGTFAAKTVGTSAAIIDVGCGMYPAVPLYIAELATQHTYVGLDPIITDYSREYLFLNGTLEDAVKEIECTIFDVAVFCTSLDHFENLDEVAEATRNLLKHEGYAVFLIGLHDSDVVAGQMGAAAFREMFFSLRLKHFLLQLVRKVFFEIPRAFRVLRKRDQKLRDMKPLDQLHFHYFTLSMLRERLSQSFGEVVELILVPNTNAVFVACRMRK